MSPLQPLILERFRSVFGGTRSQPVPQPACQVDLSVRAARRHPARGRS
jgi:hypothetical protein